MVRVLLRAEGLAVFFLAAAAYGQMGGRWLWFVVLLLTPDLAMLGYLVGPRVGSTVYNVVHTYVVPVALVAAGWVLDAPIIVLAGLVLAAHIGLDRAMGYGLKYPSGFKDTHVQRV